MSDENIDTTEQTTEQTTDLSTTSTTTVEDVHTAASSKDSTDVMTGELVNFVSDLFEMARNEDSYEETLKKDIIANLADFKPSEKMALLTAAQANKNDLVNKSVTPLFNMLATAQANELQERKEMQKNQTTLAAAAISSGSYKEAVLTTPVDVLQGLQALLVMEGTFKKNPPLPQADAQTAEATSK